MMSSRNLYSTKQGEILKIAILGLGSVGKTTISKSYSGELNNPDEITMTKGVDITVKRVILQNNYYTLQIWDFAGQKQFRFMIDVFLRGIKGIMYVYDVTDIETLLDLNEFVDLARDYLINNNYSNIPEILVGNKADLGEAEVSIEDIHNFMKMYNLKKHFLVSGLFNANVSEPFEHLVSEIIKEKQSLSEEIISKYNRI